MVREADIMDAETEMGGITMKYCKQCGKEMADGLRKCPNCGAEAGNGSFSKWSVGLIACNAVAVLSLFLSWVKINAWGVSKTISPVQLVGYLRDADDMIGYYLTGYSDKVGLLTFGGVCLIVAYAVSVLLTMMKKDYAFFVGLLAHLAMCFFSGEVVSVGGDLKRYTYQMASLGGAAYFAFVLSAVASILCFYVLAFHLGVEEKTIS